MIINLWMFQSSTFLFSWVTLHELHYISYLTKCVIFGRGKCVITYGQMCQNSCSNVTYLSMANVLWENDTQSTLVSTSVCKKKRFYNWLSVFKSHMTTQNIYNLNQLKNLYFFYRHWYSPESHLTTILYKKKLHPNFSIQIPHYLVQF